jgi:hypothetical protein
LSWELERPSVAPGCGSGKQRLPITGEGREVAGGHQGVGGVVVPLEGQGRHNPAGGKGPCFIDARRFKERIGECPHAG